MNDVWLLLAYDFSQADAVVKRRSQGADARMLVRVSPNDESRCLNVLRKVGYEQFYKTYNAALMSFIASYYQRTNHDALRKCIHLHIIKSAE